MKSFWLFLVFGACGDGTDGHPDPGSFPAKLDVLQSPLHVGEAAAAGISWELIDTLHAGPCGFPLGGLTCTPITEYAFVIGDMTCDGCTVAEIEEGSEYLGFGNLEITATRPGMTKLQVELVDPYHGRQRSLDVTTPAE